jgi:Skp family chaperone for outer membrane proteins
VKQKDLEKRISNFYRDIESGLLKESLAQQMQMKLKTEQENLANLEAGYTTRINEMQRNLNVIYFDSLWNFIERHKAEFGVDMVVGYQQGLTNIFFADDALDITAQVIEMMNAEYIARYPDKKNLKKRKK